MKYITFCVPMYNSEEYMEHAIKTLLTAKDDIELILVNDGSTDNTLSIAKKYEKKYPNIIKVIDKENGGHGSGVNAGLKSASGLYYKVVDSDDWVDIPSLKKVINTIKDIYNKDNLVDMMIVNYVYEKDNEQKEISYKKILPENKIFTWDDIGKFKVDTYLLMHSVIYNTKMLKSTKINLPEHTFYVDNIFVYYPLPSVKTMYYLNIPFYRYFIGRVDQSVNESVMIKRIDQQIYVTKCMIDYFNPYDYMDSNKNLAKYLIHYIDIMMCVSTILLQVSNTKENTLKIKDLWNYLKDKNPILYKKLRFSLSGLCRLPRFISVNGYRLARKIYKFN